MGSPTPRRMQANEDNDLFTDSHPGPHRFEHDETPGCEVYDCVPVEQPVPPSEERSVEDTIEALVRARDGQTERADQNAIVIHELQKRLRERSEQVAAARAEGAAQERERVLGVLRDLAAADEDSCGYCVIGLGRAIRQIEGGADRGK